MARSRSARRRPAPKPVVPEDLLALVRVGEPRVDPAGRRLVFVRSQPGERNRIERSLWLVDLAEDGSPAADARAFTSGPHDGSPRWSPDGRTIAFLRGGDDRPTQIHLIDADGGESRAVTTLPEGAIRDLTWSPDGRRLAFAFRRTADERTRAAADARKESGASTPPLVIDDLWYRLDGDGYFGSDRFVLVVLDLESGDLRTVWSRDTLGGFTFDFSPDGQRLAVATNTDRKAMLRPWKCRIVILDVDGGTPRPVAGLPDGPKTGVKWSPDGTHLAWAGREGRDSVYSVENLELWVARATGGAARSLTADTDHCLLAIALSDSAEAAFSPVVDWAPDGSRITTVLGHHGTVHVASIARRGGPIAWHTDGTSVHAYGNRSDDGRVLALTRSTATEPTEVFVGVAADAGGSRRGRPTRNGRRRTAGAGGTGEGPWEVHRATDFNDAWRASRTISPIHEMWVEAEDGTRVHTWVMLPPGRTPKSRGRRLPAVLEVHGGPHAMYGVGFFHEFQCLASSGYAVVFSNPRGSKGYGRDHCAAIRGRWGTADWVDVQAITAMLQQHPSIDPDRIGIMGGSYGGYMTNWAIAHSDAYCAAITDRCVANVVTMAGTSDYVRKPDDYFPGNHWDDTEARAEQSPLRHIGGCTTPTLIIHSEGDLRCSIEQAEQLFVALKLLDVETRFVRYPRSSSHGMSRSGPPDLRLHRLHQILDWWADHFTRPKKGRRSASSGRSRARSGSRRTGTTARRARSGSAAARSDGGDA